MTINFVLCNASLELHRARSSQRRSLPQSFSLLNEEDHYREAEGNDVHRDQKTPNAEGESDEEEGIARPAKFRRRNWKEVRPDILHFCLMALQDSILNKEGHIAIWVHTLNSQIYRVYPEFRIPRTFKVFNKVMAKYLHSNSRCLKPEGDENTILVERVKERLEDLGQGAIKVAISSKGRLVRPEEFFQKEITDKDNIWLYVSLSNYTPLPVADESGIICVADINKRLVERMDKTPDSATYSEEIERKMLSEDTTSSKSSMDFEHNISISSCYPSAMSTCYKLACVLESLLGF